MIDLKKTATLMATGGLVVFALAGCAGQQTSSSSSPSSGSEEPSATAQTADGDTKGPNPSMAAAVTQENNVIGNDKVGFVEFPVGWEDRSVADFGQELVDSAGIVHVVEPQSKQDKVAGNNMPIYTTYVHLVSQDRSYTDAVSDMKKSYGGDEMSADVSETNVAGHSVTVFRSTDADSDAKTVNVIIDTGDSGSHVELFASAGDGSQEQVEDIIKTWRFTR